MAISGPSSWPAWQKQSELNMFDEYGFPGERDADHAAPILATFVYCSRAAESVDDAEVDRIIAWSQCRNVDRGVTGVLVFGSGVFFQWIEGPPAEIASLTASLHSDPRHHDIVPLDQSVDKRERLYPNWEMERVSASDIRDVLENALGESEDENSIAALQRIIGHLDTGDLIALGQS
jgi:hypothetical protein